MRSRLATVVFAAAAAAAGAGLTPRPAESHPVQVDPFAQLEQLKQDNHRLEHEVDALRAGLDDIDRLNHRNRDRYARRAIDRVIDGLRDDDWGDDDGRDGRRDDNRRDDDHRDHREQAQLLSKADFDQLRAHVAGASFDSNRLDLVRSAAQIAVFTSDQVVALMQTSSFDDTRIEIAATL